jgi:hypothetical protein
VPHVRAASGQPQPLDAFHQSMHRRGIRPT